MPTAYWKNNPIKAFTNKETAPFKLDGELFICQTHIKAKQLSELSSMAHELVELRLEPYSLRSL